MKAMYVRKRSTKMYRWNNYFRFVHQHENNLSSWEVAQLSGKRISLQPGGTAV